MSYEIIYEKCYIKVEDNLFCPIALMGSNNCYEVQRNRRSRSWGNLTYITGGSILATKEQIAKTIDEERLKRIKDNEDYRKNNPNWDIYSDDNYGYWTGVAMYGKHTSRTTFQQYKGFWVNACNSAQTVEVLREHHINVNIHAYVWDEAKFKKETGKEVLRVYPKTSKEFADEVKNFEDYYRGTGASVYVSLDMYDENLARKMRVKLSPKVKREKTKQTINEFYVLGNHLGYFSKRLKGSGYKYSYDKTSYICKRFLTEKTAQSFVNKLNKLVGEGHTFSPIKVEKEVTIYV